MPTNYFSSYPNSNNVNRTRVISTPSDFCKKNLFYVQETGYLKSQNSHSNVRKGLNSFLFFIVLSGNGYLKYKQQKFLLQPYDCVFIDCMEEHSHGNSYNSPWELLWVHFNGISAPAYYKYFSQTSSNIFTLKNPNIVIDSITNIIKLQKNRDISTDILTSKYITEILTESIINHISGDFSTNNGFLEKLLEVKNFLDSNYHTRIFLDDLEERFFISKFYLSREFKRIYGVTITTYIQDKRVTKAKELLRFSSLPIEAIAEECGIPDASYFNKVFKKSEGITPSDYKKQW